jgi:hypothetical protein
VLGGYDGYLLFISASVYLPAKPWTISWSHSLLPCTKLHGGTDAQWSCSLSVAISLNTSTPSSEHSRSTSSVQPLFYFVREPTSACCQILPLFTSDGMDDPFITMGNSGSSEFNMPSGYDACPSRPESPIARPSIPQRQSSHTYKPIKRIACLGSGFVGGQSSLHLLPETLYCPLPRGRIRLMEVPLAFMLARFLSAYVLIVSNRAYVSGHCVQDRSRSYCR